MKGFIRTTMAVAIVMVLALVAVGIKRAYALDAYAVATECQAFTRDAPTTTAPTAGAILKLDRAKKIRICFQTYTSSACTTIAGNITGGNLEIWNEHPIFDWTINPDLTLAAGAPGTTRRCFGDIESPGGNSAGGLFVRANAITAASGTHIKFYAEAVVNE